MPHEKPFCENNPKTLCSCYFLWLVGQKKHFFGRFSTSEYFLFLAKIVSVIQHQMENKFLTVILVQLQALETRFQASQSHHFVSWQAHWLSTKQDHEPSSSFSVSSFFQKINNKMDTAQSTEEVKVWKILFCTNQKLLLQVKKAEERPKSSSERNISGKREENKSSSGRGGADESRSAGGHNGFEHMLHAGLQIFPM